MCALVTGVQTCALPISREGDGEWARNEPSHIDQDRSAMPCLDRELEAEHRIGLHGLRRDRRESDRPALAGMPAHAPCGPGSSAGSPPARTAERRVGKECVQYVLI